MVIAVAVVIVRCRGCDGFESGIDLFYLTDVARKIGSRDVFVLYISIKSNILGAGFI